jgi:hypothetical protein
MISSPTVRRLAIKENALQRKPGGAALHFPTSMTIPGFFQRIPRIQTAL